MIKTIIDFSLGFRTVSLSSRNKSDLKPHCIFPLRVARIDGRCVFLIHLLIQGIMLMILFEEVKPRYFIKKLIIFSDRYLLTRNA